MSSVVMKFKNGMYCHPEMWNLSEKKKIKIIKQKSIYFSQVLFQKLCKEKAGKTLHYFLKVS